MTHLFKTIVSQAPKPSSLHEGPEFLQIRAGGDGIKHRAVRDK